MVGKNILEHPLAREWEILAPTSSDLDLMDAKSVMRYVAMCQPHAVIHAAGHVGGIQANMASPVAFLERNLIMGINIIRAAHQSGVRNFLNLASTCMYPRMAENPLAEELILTGELEPTNEGYALAKIATTRLCEYICREDPLAHYKTLIPCNLFGRHDKFEPRHSHLLPAIIHKIHLAKLNGDRFVEIWGDGNARREFMYAGDLADAVLKAVREIEVIPQLMNCGVGRDHSINDYYKAVANVIGWDGDFRYDLSRPVGMRQKLCSTDRQYQWGWSASTSLEAGVQATYDFYLNKDTV